MTTYGSGGGNLSAPRKLDTPKHSAGPRSDLQIRKGTGARTIPFSHVKKGADESGGELDVNAEEFIEGIGFHVTAGARRSQALEDSKPKTVEDTPLRSFIDAAYTSCFICREPIPGNAPRKVVITVTLPNVGGEATDCVPTTICESCSGAVNSPVIAPLIASKVPDNDWKRGLKPRQLEIWNRVKENKETQTNVARSLGLSQGEVSKILSAVARIRDSYRAQGVNEGVKE
jgi:hypothetical protein